MYIIIILLISIIIILVYNIYFSIDSQNINRLIRQTARWSTAAEQDTNPYIANLHATYAMGYLMALREIYPDEIISQKSGINIRELDIKVNKIMDDAIQKLIIVCPEGQPKSKFLAYLSGQGQK
jgi:hypothetical protein